MSIENADRIAVVTSEDGSKYLGWIPEDVGEPSDYVDLQFSSRQPVVLKSARAYVKQMIPQQGPRGQMAGMGMFQALTPIDMLSGPAEELRVAPSTWYFPFKNKGTDKAIRGLIDAAERNEQANRAAESGIATAQPGDLPNGVVSLGRPPRN